MTGPAKRLAAARTKLDSEVVPAIAGRIGMMLEPVGLSIFRMRSVRAALGSVSVAALALSLGISTAMKAQAQATGGGGGTGFSTSNDNTGGSGGAANAVGEDGHGGGGSGGAAGTSASPTGGAGGAGSGGFGGSGGGGGGGGATGPFPDAVLPFTGIGGDGGIGGVGANGGVISSGGGGGGAGGDASRFAALPGVTVILTDRIGGNGGNGGAATLASGGGGGGGGAGVVLLTPGTLEIFHDVTGGAGGAGGGGGIIGTGGTGGTGSGGAAGGVGGSGVGGGGGGGAGIVMQQGGSLIIDSGFFIRGGAGGTGAQGGAGGAGIVGGAGGNTAVIVAGFVVGGLGGDGVTRANAISLFGSNNRLEIDAHPIFGSGLFTGNVVVSGGGSNNVLTLGGSVDADFDVSQIGGAGQYRGFDTFQKTGTSTWTLFGGGNQNWSMDSGVLRADTGSLTGNVTFATGAGTRGVTFDQNSSGTYAGTMSGDGALTKAGTGTVTLTGTHSYTGGTTIQAGTLQLGDATHLATIVGAVTVNAGGGFDLVNANTAGLTTITNAGLTRFFGNTSPASMAISNGAGGKTDFSGSTGPAGDGRLAAGSIAGAGQFFLGNRELTVGGNGASTIVSGVISDGSSSGGGASGGSLVKIGAGTLTLSGVNSYTGGTTIAAGVLSVAADANLGGAAGALIFNGGTLASTGSFDSARNVTLAQAGRFDVTAATTLGLTGVVAGGGDLVKLGAGTLRLDNVGNAYGNSFVQAGTLIGQVGSLSGTIGNAGTVVFQQGSDASFAGDILALNGVRGAMVKQGAGILTLTGSSALDWTIAAGGLVTAAERFGGNAAISAGATLTFGQSVNAAYAGALSGSGSFHKAGSGALNLTGNSAGFTGTTLVDVGLLSVNGSLANSAVTVAAGAALGGNGSVGDTVVAGTIAPGNSIGTLHVAGNITFNPGSTYSVELSAGGQSDLIDVTGAATINGGTVQIANVAGSYKLGARYTVVTATGGVTGTFSSLTAPSARWAPFLAFALAYDPNAVYLDVTRNGVLFTSVAQTRNQIATAGALDSLPQSGSFLAAIAQLDAPGARNAFDQLSGEMHASVATALVEGSGFLRDSAANRIRGAFDAVGATHTPVMAFAEPVHGDPATAFASLDSAKTLPATAERFTLWGQGFGGWGHTGSDGNAARLNRSTAGFVTGGDAPVFDNGRLGLMAGYSRTSFDVRDRASSGASDNYHLGLYGGAQWGRVGFRSGAAYSWHDISTARSIAFTGFSDSLKADHRAATAQVFGELGYGFRAGKSGLEPFVNLAYVNFRNNGFAETGGAAALHGSSGSTDTTFTTLGLHGSTEFTLFGAALTARATSGWRHAFGDTVLLSTLTFAGSSSFTVAGVPIARDALVLDAGLDVALARNATLGIAYGAQFGSGAADQNVKGTLAVRF